MTSGALAAELEVAQRTILRDVDALTEAGLPMVVHAGYRGGIELGFEYRTRLTGLASDEAEAIGVLLARPTDELAPLGIADAANRARRKLLESLPDSVRARAAEGSRRFQFLPRASAKADDPRLRALADAIRCHRVVRIHAFQSDERVIHPIGLVCTKSGWLVEDDVAQSAIRLRGCGDINVSSKSFVPRSTKV
jgi:predicted DNA-binding transcriptional regulator YafY